MRINNTVEIVSVMIMFLISHLFSCKDSADSAGLVIAENGLPLLESPSQKSENIAVIPYLEKINISKFSKNSEQIDNINSKWAFINYDNFSG